MLDDGVGQFVSLFNGEAAEGFEGLFAIPRALHAKFVHDVQ